MVRRHRPIRARKRHRLAVNRPRIVAYHIKRTHTLAIDAEVLVAGIADERFVDLLEHEPHPGRVGVEPVAQALIRKIEERNEPTRRNRLRNRTPLLHRVVGARRIVTARLKQHHIARRSARQRAHRLVEQQRLRLAVEMLEPFDGKPRRIEQRPMVRPGRLAEPNLRLRTNRRD